MECKKMKTLGRVSLVISVLPLATLIPVFKIEDLKSAGDCVILNQVQI